MHNIYCVKTSGNGDGNIGDVSDAEGNGEEAELAAAPHIFESLKQEKISLIFNNMKAHIAVQNANFLNQEEKDKTQGILFKNLTQAMYDFYNLVYERGTDKTRTDQFAMNLLNKMQEAQVPLENIEKTMDLLFASYLKQPMYKKEAYDLEIDRISQVEEKKRYNYAAWLQARNRR